MSDVSLIIPTRNRADLLANALTSIAKVVSPSDPVEIIVVDNGSSDRTQKIFQDINDRFSRNQWRYVYDDMPGLLTGRHRGAREAKGDILSYLDDDIELVPGWLGALNETFSNPNVVLAGGPSTPVFQKQPPSWLQDFWTEIEGGRQCGWLSLIDCGCSIKRIDPLCIWGLNFSIRRQTFEYCRGFHPDCLPKPLQRYQGDGETGLAYKIKDAKFTCLYHPGLAVKHVIPASRLTASSFEQRAFYQGVCDSFAQIRRNQGVRIEPARPLKNFVRLFKSRINDNLMLHRQSTKDARRLTDGAYLAGMRFHENEVLNDPRLLDWVLRLDYLDYRLPVGWRSYLCAERS